MPEHYWDLVGIETVDGPDATFEYYATMDGLGIRRRVPVSADALLCYYQFQREMLIRGGLAYRYFVSEGRDQNAANEIWREMTTSLVNRHTLAVIAAEKAGKSA